VGTRKLASVPTALSGYPPGGIGACLAPPIVRLVRAVKVVHSAPYACAARLHLDRAHSARGRALRKARGKSASRPIKRMGGVSLILAGEGLEFFHMRLDGQTAFLPVIDRLANNKDMWPPVPFAYLESCRELPEGKAHGYGQRAMARATSFKLVMRHFAPSPISEARCCSLAAACGLRRALRAAAMRLRASCRFTSLESTVFTGQLIPQSGS
jgi:hypothetical protein